MAPTTQATGRRAGRPAGRVAGWLAGWLLAGWWLVVFPGLKICIYEYDTIRVHVPTTAVQNVASRYMYRDSCDRIDLQYRVQEGFLLQL